MANLSGKTALITGSTSGIGLGIAESLAAEGANIMLNGFGDASEIAALQARLAQKHGVKVSYSNADISSADAIAAMIAQTNTELGGVDILVNNAGIQFVASIEEFPTAKWESILSINLSSNFYAMQHTLAAMKAKGWGRVINIASAHGLVASAHKAAYVAAKHGVVGLTKVAGLEYAGTGVTVNAICPGWVLTPLVQKQIDAIAAENNLSEPAAREKLLSEKQPSKQFATPEEIGGLCVFLCSPAAAQITGTHLSVDGGWTAQ